MDIPLREMPYRSVQVTNMVQRDGIGSQADLPWGFKNSLEFPAGVLDKGLPEPQFLHLYKNSDLPHRIIDGMK